MSADRPASELRLVLQLNDREEGVAVRVLEAPFGAGRAADVVLPRLEDVLRAASQPAFHADVGKGLFRALVPADLQEVYRVALAEATAQGVPLTLELRFDPDRLDMARYPWELLHDGTRFPVQTGAVHLRRTVPYVEPPSPPQGIDSPLEVLFVAAHPPDQEALISLYNSLADLLAGAQRDGQLDLAYLLPPSWAALADWLLAGAPHILHFEGHTALARAGRLAFEGAREADWVDAAALGGLVACAGLRALVLGAAGTAGAGDGLPAGAAPSLVRAGVPVVVALQGVLPPEVAGPFFAAFYRALAAGRTVAAALEQARRTLRRTVVWHLPAIFTRAVGVQPAPAEFEPRFDVAAPRYAARGYPLRVAVWLRETTAPLPARTTLERVVGAGWHPDPNEPVTPDHRRAHVVRPLASGTVELRLSAPGCEIHSPTRYTLAVHPGAWPPPVWVALTPRRTGPVELRCGWWQGGEPIAAFAHRFEVRDVEGGAAELAVVSYGAGGSATPSNAQLPGR